MSINHITNDTPIKQWMNIGASSIKCTNLEAENITIDDLTLEQLTIDSNLVPQLSVSNPNVTSSAVVKIGDSAQGILSFTDELSANVGRIQARSLDNVFQIDPEDSLDVEVEGPVQLLKNSSISNPDANHVSLYAKQGDDELYIKNSTGTESQLLTHISIPPYIPSYVYRNTTIQFVPATIIPQEIFSGPGGVGTTTIAANTLENNKIIRLRISGELVTSASPTSFQFAVLRNGTAVVQTDISVSPVPQTVDANSFELEFIMTFFTKDIAPDKIDCKITGGFMSVKSNPQYVGMDGFVPSPLTDYTISNTYSISMINSNNDVPNGCSVFSATMEVIG